MTRLPVVGSDVNNWGTLLDAFLGVAHNVDGSLKAFINVKDSTYGAAGDGVTDDTSAIATALSAANAAGGGTVFFPAGTYLTGNQTIYTNVHIRGAGITATTIKLKNGANADLFSGQTGNINLAAASGVGPAGTLYNFGFYDLTLDGNKANQSGGPSYPIRVYAYGYIMQNLRIKNGYNGGIISDWNAGPATPGNDAMESQWSNIKIHDNNGIGLQIGGPHDTQWINMKVYNSGSHDIHIAPNATAIQGTNVHAWNIGTGAVGFLIEAGYCLFYNCESELTSGMSVAMLASECSWDGHIFDASYTNNTNGLQLGQQAGQTPYAGQILQAAGVTTAAQVSNCNVRGNFDDCGLSHGAIWFANTSGGNMIFATIYQTAGNGITGTPDSQDSYWIYVKGLTADGSIGHGGAFHMATSCFNGFQVSDQSGNQFFQVFPAGVGGGGGFLLGCGGQFKGYSDAFFSVKQWQIDSSTGDIQTNGNLALGESATEQVITTGGTINTADVGVARVAPTGNITGVILQPGTIKGQKVTVWNNSAFTITFAAVGTSHVADGTLAVIIANHTMDFTWNSVAGKWAHS